MALSISSNINILPDEEEKKLESNTSTETSEDNLFKSELNINDIIIIGQCIEALNKEALWLMKWQKVYYLQN